MASAAVRAAECRRAQEGDAFLPAEVGEYVVGAYLKVIERCDVVDYNLRYPGGGLKGMGELDVVGFRFARATPSAPGEPSMAYLCEVATHLEGVLYGGGAEATLKKLREKLGRQKEYAHEYLSTFDHHVFMFWAPRVPEGRIADELRQVAGLQLVINQEYTRCVDELKARARARTDDTGNPFFRTLQVLEHLRR